MPVFPDPEHRVRRQRAEATSRRDRHLDDDGGGGRHAQPNPVWFVVEDGALIVYNRPDALRLRHIKRNPRVAFNLDGDGKGDDIIVLVGTAEVVEDYPLTHEHAGLRREVRRAGGRCQRFHRGVRQRVLGRGARGHRQGARLLTADRLNRRVAVTRSGGPGRRPRLFARATGLLVKLPATRASVSADLDRSAGAPARMTSDIEHLVQPQQSQKAPEPIGSGAFWCCRFSRCSR